MPTSKLTTVELRENQGSARVNEPGKREMVALDEFCLR